MICHKYLATHLLIFLSSILPVYSQSTGKERTLQNPGYVEIAKCPCDVTESQCDFNCCCDDECTMENKARFEYCIPGLVGGQGGEKEAYKCATKVFNPPDWHVLTCVYWENNAYLGMFFMNKAKIASQDAFTSAVNKYMEDEFSLSLQERRYVDKDFALTDFHKGLVVQTTRQPAIASTQPNSDGYLSLPQYINSGQCNPLAPVRFLEPFQSSCVSQLTDSSCSPLTSFSANVYVVSSSIKSSSRPFQVTSTFNGKTLANTDVRYYCTTDLTDYLSSTTTPLEDLASSTGSNLPNTLQNMNCNEPCANDACWQYNTNRAYVPVYDKPLPARCAFDDGQTLPSSPILDVGTCKNVVLEVRYSFEWEGPVIKKLIADVVLADITRVSSTPTDLFQRFSVKWTHSTNTTDVTDNYYNSSQPYERSGIAGYNPGRTLHSGCQQIDPFTNKTGAVDTRLEKQMAVFRPGVDGLCVNSQRETLAFGKDVMSSCALRLKFDDLESCDSLRWMIGNQLNILMPSDVIGRYGYNDPANQDMWISVLRQNLSQTFESSPVVASNVLLGNETAFRLADYVAGICLVPTSVNLMVLYAKTGAINYHPRYEVIGAYVNYTLGNWTMQCMGSNSQRCSSTSGQTQNFFLHSNVRYIEVPPVPPTPKERFYTRINPETCDSDSCERFYSHWATDVCYYDTCWQEIAYPLTSVYEGDSHEYALAFFLVLVLGIVGYASVTKPGWK